MKKIVESIVLIVIAVVLPLAGNLRLVFTWPALSVAAIGIVLIFTQPPVPNKTEIDQNKGRDKKTAFMLLASSLIAYQIALIEAAYFKEFPTITNLTAWVGISLMLFGMFYRWYAIRHLGRFFTAQVTILKDHKLLQDGPYKRLRHPSYTAAFITFVGIAILFQSFACIVYVIWVIFPIQAYRIKIEEKALVEEFRGAYTNYQKKSKKMFPFVW